MQIILVPNGRAVTLSSRQSMLLLLALLGAPFLLASLLYYLTLVQGLAIRIPYVQSLVLNAQQREAEKNRLYLQENLNALSLKLGQMQAQLVRLDALGERLAKTSGIKPEEFHFGELPGRGGAESALPTHQFGLRDFRHQLAALAESLSEREKRLGKVEATLLQNGLKELTFPSMAPVAVGWSSSNFGWRIDPFTGREAFHEGMDFMAEEGTPVVAAAAGTVVYSAHHSQYGNMVEIDHGNGLTSRYAHASALMVKAGDTVLKGQRIALVGSTGRSTGPHLHFEVRRNGAPQNPERFLRQPG